MLNLPSNATEDLCHEDIEDLFSNATEDLFSNATEDLFSNATEDLPSSPSQQATYDLCPEATEKPLNILIFSSLFFITNCVTCIIYEKIIHCILLFLLTCSSILVHYNDNIITNILDKIVIGFVFLSGFHLFLTKPNKNIIIVLTILFVVFVYIYGYINNKYVFDENDEISKKYHILMHLIGSIGHHLVVL